MPDATRTNRRRFLAGSAGVLAAGLLPAETGRRLNAADPQVASEAGGRFVAKSQPLAEPRVVLPTDRLPPPDGRKKRIVALTTAWWKYSHADDIITKFIEGYAVLGRTHLPHCRIVGLYVEQFPESDISRGMAARYRIPMFKTPGEALTLGGKELAADGVLLIGEHGDFPLNEKGQKLYPRRRLFEEIVKVFRSSGRSVPVYNDKHFSYSWKNAEWMCGQSRELKFPMMAGSSVPVSWRRPPLAFRRGVPLKSALVAGSGSFESYGFHCLELLQTFVEKRRGGETGVKAVQALEGAEAVGPRPHGRTGHWPAHLLPAVLRALPESSKNSNKDWRERGVVFRVEYADGFEAAVCLTGGLVSEYTFAAEVAGLAEPLACWTYLPQPQRDHFSFLCNHIEVMFRSGKPSYPVERTLLTTGVLEALHDSRQQGGKRIETPHLGDLAYTPAEEFPTSN